MLLRANGNQVFYNVWKGRCKYISPDIKNEFLEKVVVQIPREIKWKD